jgi:aconitate hydratase
MPEGATATDLVLQVTQMLRAHGVVGKFVEFTGPGLQHLSLADRATIANMAPEYGATCGIFPVDQETLNFMRLSGRSEEQIALTEAYMKEQGMFHTPDAPTPEYTDLLELDMASVVPSLAGPKRPQDRVALTDLSSQFQDERRQILAGAGSEDHDHRVPVSLEDETFELKNGSVVIAAITSCTNTSNPSVMVAAGLVAKKAALKGLRTKPWVKTSLAPGSKVVTDYLDAGGLTPYLNALGFDVVGFGCTTCIGNSGPLAAEIVDAIDSGDLVAASVLSGNRNFEGRVHAKTRANYLASPPLVVAYALAGDVNIDLATERIGVADDGSDVFLRDIWPTNAEIQEIVGGSVTREMYADSYAKVFDGTEEWERIEAAPSSTFDWQEDSTYVRLPPYFEGMGHDTEPVGDIRGARVLGLFGDNLTTDHISPAGAIPLESPAGVYLRSLGVEKEDFNSFGSRRGNHEVMMRGTFGNVRIKNRMVPGVEGGVTVHFPSGKQMSIYDAAMEYRAAGIPSIVLGGKEYGMGSSRDWAAKGPALQGVRAVIVESFERIHRSNLVGMGILPLQFEAGESADSLGLDGSETFDLVGLEERFRSEDSPTGGTVNVTASRSDGGTVEFKAVVRIDTPAEADYYRNNGILNYVLRRLAR